MTDSNEPTRIRTRIVATIGPASWKPEVLRKLIAAGVNVFRLNFSHGTHPEHSAVLANIRALSREMGQHVAVLQDLGGPKMRLGQIPGDEVECPLGAEFVLVTERTSDNPRELTCTYRALPNDLEAGETVLFADGTVAMKVTETRANQAFLQVTLPGRLRSRQGMNLPGSTLAVESLTEKDLRDLDWTAQHAADIDFVGLSFARSAEDVIRLRHELALRKCPARIVVKIEKPSAVENIEEIIAATDCVMVARGDLGVEMSVHRVPAIQKHVIALCNQANRPVITATQMLNSMEHSSRPTRAEASDVFNAVLDGTDAVMLSGETAVGEYPIDSVETMRRICVEAESQVEPGRKPAVDHSASIAELVEPMTEASADAAELIAERLHAPLIVVATNSGRTALALSSRRPSANILALARSEPVARALSLCWGVTPLVLSDAAASPERELQFGIDWAKSHALVAPGQQAVLFREQVAGHAASRAILAG